MENKRKNAGHYWKEGTIIELLGGRAIPDQGSLF
jgi:hypothetical protein